MHKEEVHMLKSDAWIAINLEAIQKYCVYVQRNCELFQQRKVAMHKKNQHKKKLALACKQHLNYVFSRWKKKKNQILLWIQLKVFQP